MAAKNLPLITPELLFRIVHRRSAYVYKPLENGAVLEELDRINPKINSAKKGSINI